MSAYNYDENQQSGNPDRLESTSAVDGHPSLDRGRQTSHGVQGEGLAGLDTYNHDTGFLDPLLRDCHSPGGQAPQTRNSDHTRPFHLQLDGRHDTGNATPRANNSNDTGPCYPPLNARYNTGESAPYTNNPYDTVSSYPPLDASYNTGQPAPHTNNPYGTGFRYPSPNAPCHTGEQPYHGGPVPVHLVPQTFREGVLIPSLEADLAFSSRRTEAMGAEPANGHLGAPAIATSSRTDATPTTPSSVAATSAYDASSPSIASSANSGGARGAQRYQCGYEGCEKTFTRAGDAQRHRASKHNLGEVLFYCAELDCLFEAARRDKMTEHCRAKHNHEYYHEVKRYE